MLLITAIVLFAIAFASDRRNGATMAWMGLAIAFQVAACNQCPDAPMVSTQGSSKPCPTSPAPASPDAGPATCETVCAHELALGCTQAKPTQEGATCETVCLNAVSSGLFKLNLACRLSATSCAAAEACAAK